MTFPRDPKLRLPRGDKNRRLALGISRDAMASGVGVSPEQLRQYEFTQPDRDFDLMLADRVGATLERLEATITPLVYNGPVPCDDVD